MKLDTVRSEAIKGHFCVLSIVMLAVFFVFQPSFAATRIALVIGNSTYDAAPLKNPAYDAKDMAVTLKRLGFNVILKQNADKRAMLDALRSFGKKLLWFSKRPDHEKT